MLVFFCLLLLGLLLISGIDGVLIPYLTDGLSNEEFLKLNLKNSPEFIYIRRIEQLVVQTMLFIVPALVLAYLSYPKPAKYLKFTTKLNYRHLVLGILIMTLFIPFIGLLEYLNGLIPLTDGMKEIEASAKDTIELLLTSSNTGTIVFNVLIFVLVPAIAEELLFRGGFQNILLGSQTFKKYPIMAIAVAAIFFSLMHMQMAGFIPRFFAGFLLGCAYYFSNNIIVPIAMHALNNGFVILTFYLSRSNFDNPIGTLDYKDFLEIVPLTIISLFLFYKFYQKRTEYVIDKVEVDPDDTHFLANK